MKIYFVLPVHKKDTKLQRMVEFHPRKIIFYLYFNFKYTVFVLMEPKKISM